MADFISFINSKDRNIGNMDYFHSMTNTFVKDLKKKGGGAELWSFFNTIIIMCACKFNSSNMFLLHYM